MKAISISILAFLAAAACAKQDAGEERTFVIGEDGAPVEVDAAGYGADIAPGQYDQNAPGQYAPSQNATGAAFGATRNGGGVTQGATGRPLPADAVVLQKISIQDPGVIAPGEAMTALIPAGWTQRGGVAGTNGLCAEPFVMNWSASSPDGQSMVAILPTEVWQWSNAGIRSDCMAGDYSDARSYIERRMIASFQGVRVLDYRNRPDFARGAQEHAANMQQMINQSGLEGMTVRAEGGEALFAYMQNGVEMRGVAGVTAIFYESALANPMGGAPMRTLSAQTLGTFAATAPNGKLDFRLTEAVRRSIAPNAQWLRKLFELKGAIGEINAKGTQERAAMIVAGGAAATRSNIASFEAMARAGAAKNASSGGSGSSGSGELFPGEASQARTQRETIEGVRGVETYHDPVEGGQVQLDATYDHAWRMNNKDAYILTNDPNFNPGQYGLEATQMGVVQ